VAWPPGSFLCIQFCAELISIFSGTHTIDIEESAIEGSLAFKAGIHIGFRDGLIRIFQKMYHISKSGIIQILIEVRMEGSGEDS
jgi:hypothetical protein